MEGWSQTHVPQGSGAQKERAKWPCEEPVSDRIKAPSAWADCWQKWRPKVARFLFVCIFFCLLLKRNIVFFSHKIWFFKHWWGILILLNTGQGVFTLEGWICHGVPTVTFWDCKTPCMEPNRQSENTHSLFPGRAPPRLRPIFKCWLLMSWKGRE